MPLTNFLSRGEPLARIQANRLVLRFVNGFAWMLRDPRSVIARTPYEVVFARDKLELRHYTIPESLETWAAELELGGIYPVPVLLVPPLMVKPFIFDLHPGRSLVRYLQQAGFDVYLVDFGEPTDKDSVISLDDYVLDFLPRVTGELRARSNGSGFSFLGYCMGGLFSLMYAAAHKDPAVRNLVCIATPVDTDKMGLLATLAKIMAPQVEFISDRLGNVPGGLSSTVFKMLTPLKSLTRWADLFLNMWNEEYVDSFDAMGQWVSQFIDYPHEAFKQFFREIIKANKLKDGRMRFGRKTVDLRNVRCSVLAVAGESDRIAAKESVAALLELISSTDKQLEVVPGGHMGVFAGSHAPEMVWRKVAAWLGERSGSRIAMSKARGRGRKRATAAPTAGREGGPSAVRGGV